jgi:hypothetical protein
MSPRPSSSSSSSSSLDKKTSTADQVGTNLFSDGHEVDARMYFSTRPDTDEVTKVLMVRACMYVHGKPSESTRRAFEEMAIQLGGARRNVHFLM